MPDLSCYETAYPEALRSAEASCLEQRRSALSGADRAIRQELEQAPLVGLALSGGGIRSATFCLGVLQSLAQHRLLHRFDFLSTVSGGGYCGSFFGALVSRSGLGAGDIVTGMKDPDVPGGGPIAIESPEALEEALSALPDDGTAQLHVVRGGTKMRVRLDLTGTQKGQRDRAAAAGLTLAPVPAQAEGAPPSGALVEARAAGRRMLDTERELADPHSPAVSWLRENGRYLSPNGSGDDLTAGAVYLRNLVSIHVVIGSCALAILSVSLLIRALVERTAHLVDLSSRVTWRLWWSPWILLAAAVFLFLAAPAGWAYWLVVRQRRSPYRMSTLAEVFPPLTVALVAAGALGGVGAGAVSGRGSWAVLLVGLVAVLTLAYWLLASLRAGWDDKRIRNRMSSALARCLLATAVIAGVAVIDSIGQTLYAATRSLGGIKTFISVTSLAAALAAGRKVVGLFKVARPSGERPSVPMTVLASVLALVILAAELVAFSAATHAVAWMGAVPANDPWSRLSSLPRAEATAAAMSLAAVATLAGASVVLFLLIGPAMKFVNGSSYQALYAARLIRSYLGASNPRREDEDSRRITDTVEDDDLQLSDYAPHESGGPLHLVNVTLNETVRGESQLEQRDRKGLPMAIGPAGISVGVRHHALWTHGSGSQAGRTEICPIRLQAGFHVLAGANDAPHGLEGLSLGQWVAISGAAFSTGLGSRTSLGLSALLTLLNVRLGYWWDSQIDPGRRGGKAATGALEWAAMVFSQAMPVYSHLLQEMLARFHGPNRQRWLLTDGGHFENSAAYELIRRRLPFIVVCDCGQDGAYQLEDLAGLVRKARIDFKAEIRFLDAKELDDLVTDPDLRRSIGTPEDLRLVKDESAARRSKAHATLAWVDYHEHAPAAANTPRRSLLLVVKPTLSADQRLDITHYAASQKDFPHEPTSDQYFDEAQWESYRKLGEHIGRALFAPPGSATPWAPRVLAPPTAAAPPRATQEPAA